MYGSLLIRDQHCNSKFRILDLYTEFIVVNYLIHTSHYLWLDILIIKSFFNGFTYIPNYMQTKEPIIFLTFRISVYGWRFVDLSCSCSDDNFCPFIPSLLCFHFLTLDPISTVIPLPIPHFDLITAFSFPLEWALCRSSEDQVHHHMTTEMLSLFQQTSHIESHGYFQRAAILAPIFCFAFATPLNELT